MMRKLTMQGKLVWAGSIWLSAMLALAMALPVVLVKKHPERLSTDATHVSTAQSPESALQQSIAVPVYLTREKRVETYPLEDYVVGVVAAEMPIDFQVEALKAQALAARTYLVKRLIDHDVSQVPVSGAIVTDQPIHQAFLTDEQLQKQWPGDEFAVNMAKLKEAVASTKDQILTYRGSPIDAVFFSTSNGYTENSEDYWENSVSYLRSVASPWDAAISPKYKSTVTLSVTDVGRKLGVAAISPNDGSAQGMKVLSRTDGHRIKAISIGGKTFTGREVREKLGLASSQFEWRRQGSNLVFTVYGNGHGVGMSQWGAEGMARLGKTATEIVQYYYTGVEISRATNLLQEN
ncbi:MAG: stage sporulation protein [Paenibacillaceae bacterium]|jgi:stage II sporulation protein D|nr:stage sporulation protein [Paenibacillaceae bacterium]